MNIEEVTSDIMTDGKNIFDHSVKNGLITYDKIWKIATGQGDDYFKNCYKVIAIDLSKQQVFDADPKATQQISFTAI